MKSTSLSLLLLFTSLETVTCLSQNSNNAGWKSRPLVPELAKAPEAAGDAASDPAATEKSTKKKEKWDPLRFISQSSKFVTLPKPPLPLPGLTPKAIRVLPGDTIWSINSDKSNSVEKNKFTFAPLDDVVMGGVSSSTFIDGKWSGTVSDSNSGGFVGIRSTPFRSALDMSQCQGIEFLLKSGSNDEKQAKSSQSIFPWGKAAGKKGKVFKAVIRDSTDFNGVCWTETFETSTNNGSPQTVRIAFDDLIPTIFARTVPGQRLNKGTIEGFQMAYSKFLFDGELNPKFALGEFELDLIEVRAY